MAVKYRKKGGKSEKQSLLSARHFVHFRERRKPRPGVDIDRDITYFPPEDDRGLSSVALLPLAERS
jgi:hypothetical protein